MQKKKERISGSHREHVCTDEEINFLRENKAQILTEAHWTKERTPAATGVFLLVTALLALLPMLWFRIEVSDVLLSKLPSKGFAAFLLNVLVWIFFCVVELLLFRLFHFIFCLVFEKKRSERQQKQSKRRLLLMKDIRVSPAVVVERISKEAGNQERMTGDNRMYYLEFRGNRRYQMEAELQKPPILYGLMNGTWLLVIRGVDRRGREQRLLQKADVALLRKLSLSEKMEKLKQRHYQIVGPFYPHENVIGVNGSSFLPDEAQVTEILSFLHRSISIVEARRVLYLYEDVGSGRSRRLIHYVTWEGTSDAIVDGETEGSFCTQARRQAYRCKTKFFSGDRLLLLKTKEEKFFFIPDAKG